LKAFILPFLRFRFSSLDSRLSSVLVIQKILFTMEFFSKFINEQRNDHTWNRAAQLTAQGARALPTASAYYAIDKLPIIGWLPKYNYRWLVNDVIAGLTVGLMLIPQGLSYAKIAKIPVQYGLYSSWLPPMLYTFMGTTKGGSQRYQETWVDN